MFKSGQIVDQFLPVEAAAALYITNLNTHEGGFFAFSGDTAIGSPVDAGH